MRHSFEPRKHERGTKGTPGYPGGPARAGLPVHDFGVYLINIPDQHPARPIHFFLRTYSAYKFKMVFYPGLRLRRSLTVSG